MQTFLVDQQQHKKYFYQKTMFVGPNLDLLCIRQLDVGPLCEHYTKALFLCKTLRKEI